MRAHVYNNEITAKVLTRTASYVILNTVAMLLTPNLDACSTFLNSVNTHIGDETHRSNDPRFDGFCCGFWTKLCKSYKALGLEARDFVQDF